MKRIFSTLLILGSLICTIDKSLAQAGQWVWIHGSGNTYNSPGNMGMQGVPSPTNDPPALYETCEWTDLNGKFWMYGGLDDNPSPHIHNDLWRYDPVDSEWTWINGTNAINDSGNYGVKGVSSPTNRPPSLGYGVPTWVDLNGNLWMFGGAQSYYGPTYADLWEYNISTNEWTWMNGPHTANPTGIYGTQGVPDSLNYPGARNECASSWVDAAGDLWMFGGYISQLYNDLWRYNIATNTWTWMNGSNSPTHKGLWGQMGIESPANEPSARRAYGHWIDNSGNFWFYGGGGLDSSGGYWQLSDLWRYNPGTNNWTWMNGQNVGSSSNVGVTGPRCATAASNQPPPRYENRAAWTDENGNFWMFGGNYSTTPFSSFGLNDLWMYCVTSNEWTFEGGSSYTNQPGSWGTIDVPSPTNMPSTRMGSPGWTDHKGHLYLFGGFDAISPGSCYNDLWEFTIDSNCSSQCPTLVPIHPVASFQSSNTVLCTNDCINFTDLSTGAASWKWSFPGAMPSSSIDENPQNVCYQTAGNFDVTLIAYSSTGTDTSKMSNLIDVIASPLTPNIIKSNDTLYCSTDTSYSSYQWYSGDSLIGGATNSSLVVTKGGNYNVKVSNKNGCSTAVGITVVIGIKNYSISNLFYISPNPATNQLILTGNWQQGMGIISIYNTLGQKLQEEKTKLSNSVIINLKDLSSGVYFISVQDEKGTGVAKFVKE